MKKWNKLARPQVLMERSAEHAREMVKNRQPHVSGSPHMVRDRRRTSRAPWEK